MARSLSHLTGHELAALAAPFENPRRGSNWYINTLIHEVVPAAVEGLEDRLKGLSRFTIQDAKDSGMNEQELKELADTMKRARETIDEYKTEGRKFVTATNVEAYNTQVGELFNYLDDKVFALDKWREERDKKIKGLRPNRVFYTRQGRPYVREGDKTRFITRKEAQAIENDDDIKFDR